MDDLDVRIPQSVGAVGQRAREDGLLRRAEPIAVEALEMAAFGFLKFLLCSLCVAWVVKKLLLMQR